MDLELINQEGKIVSAEEAKSALFFLRNLDSESLVPFLAHTISSMAEKEVLLNLLSTCMSRLPVPIAAALESFKQRERMVRKKVNPFDRKKEAPSFLYMDEEVLVKRSVYGRIDIEQKSSGVKISISIARNGLKVSRYGKGTCRVDETSGIASFFHSK